MGKMRKIAMVVAAYLSLATAARANDITVVTTQIPNWQGNSAPVLYVVYNEPFTASDGKVVGAAMNGGLLIYQRVACSLDTLTHTLTIPSFVIKSTEDGKDVRTSTVSFFFYNANGSRIGTFGNYVNLRVPAIIATSMSCIPPGQCCTFSDLALYNAGAPRLPESTYYDARTIDQKIASAITSGNAPAGAPYITKTDAPELTDDFALGSLPTGILKNTNGTGVPTIAVAETDYSRPLSFNSPLIRSTNTISIQQATTSQSGFLSSTDWNTFNNKQASLGFTPENSANRNVTYAGLSGGKISNSQISEVLSIADLTDATGASGTGSTIFKGTVTSPQAGDVVTWTGTNWVNQTPTNTGTVTSVGFSTTVPWLTVGGSPITTNGAITLTPTGGQTANQVLATPDSTTGAVGLRGLVNNDLPVINVAHGGLNLTGLGSAYTLLGVNAGGTAYTPLTLAASGTITVTPSGSTITIGGGGTAPHNLLSSTHSDTTAASVVRGDLITGQGSGTPSWARLGLGAQYKTLQSNGSDAAYDAVHLDQSAATTGILPASRGGLGFDGSSAVNGAVPIGNGTGFTPATLIAGSNITITNGAGTIQIDASGSLGAAWSSLTSPSANLALTMNANTSTFTYGNATSTADLFVLKDSASSSGSGHLLAVNTAASSGAKPVGFFAQGTANGVEMTSAGVLLPTGTGGITANALNGVSGNGIQVRTSAGNFTSRSIAVGVGATISNGDGVSGNPTITVDLSTLTANQTLWDGSQASRTLTANLSGTDPVITFSSGVVNVSTGTLQQAGTPVVLTSRTLTGGTGINSIGDLSADRTITIDQSFSPTWTGVHTFSPSARSSGSASYLTLNIPADTNRTASTESIGFKTVTATRTWATGALTTQRENVFAAPTYAFAGTSTLTNAATLAITGAPIAGSNATITNAYSIWNQGGTIKNDGKYDMGDNAYETFAAGGNQFSKMGLQRGSAGMAAELATPVVNFQIHERPNTNGNGTVFNYLFQANRHGAGSGDGDVAAVYNLVGRITSDATGVAHDVVGVAGITATANIGHAFGLFGDASTTGTNGAAVGMEIDIRNQSNGPATDPVTGGTGVVTQGINVVSFTDAGASSSKNGFAYGIASVNSAQSAFLVGLLFGANTIDTTTGRGIDMRNVKGGSVVPILFANNTYLTSFNAAASAQKQLIGLNSSDQVSIDGSGQGTVFGAAIRPGVGSFVSGTAQIYTTASQGLVITGVAGSSYDFLLAESGGNTLLRNPAGTNSLEVATTGGNAILGGNGGALTTSATTGFVLYPSSPGAPTGTPGVVTGYIPSEVDSTNSRYWFYNSGWKAADTAFTSTVTFSTTPTFDFAKSRIQKITLGGNVSSITLSGLADGGPYVIEVIQDATGSRTVTWGTSVKWAAGTAPTLSTGANKRDQFTFVSDGTNLYEVSRVLDVR